MEWTERKTGTLRAVLVGMLRESKRRQRRGLSYSACSRAML
jgi:hypothetical protein